MARTDLPVQQVTRAGITPTYTAANVEGHAINNSGGMFLHVKNTDASPTTVTVLFGKTIDGQVLASGRAVTVPATSGDKLIGPFPADDYNQSSGKVHVDFSAVTGVTCTAFTLG